MGVPAGINLGVPRFGRRISVGINLGVPLQWASFGRTSNQRFRYFLKEPQAFVGDARAMNLLLAREHPEVHARLSRSQRDSLQFTLDTLQGSFSAVSKPNFALKYAFESSR